MIGKRVSSKRKKKTEPSARTTLLAIVAVYDILFDDNGTNMNTPRHFYHHDFQSLGIRLILNTDVGSVKTRMMMTREVTTRRTP